MSCFALRGSRHARPHVGVTFRAWTIDIPSSHYLYNPPIAEVVFKVDNGQGGVVDELADDGNEMIDSTANIAAIYVGR
jgi:hypothetical protein